MWLNLRQNRNFFSKAFTIFNLKLLEIYEILFSFLDTSTLEKLYPSTGRTPISYEALLKVLIYKNIKSLSYLSDLVRIVQDNPNLAVILGFHLFHLLCV